MPHFVYEAVDSQGKPSDGVIEAKDAQDAVARLRAKDLLPTKVNQQKPQSSTGHVIKEGDTYGSKSPNWILSALIATVCVITLIISLIAFRGETKKDAPQRQRIYVNNYGQSVVHVGGKLDEWLVRNKNKKIISIARWRYSGGGYTIVYETSK